MSNLEIDDIVAAEVESEQIMNQAITESKEKIKQAHLDAQAKLESTKIMLLNQRVQTLDKAKVDAELIRQKRLDENRLTFIEIRENAKLKLDEAVDLVIERIVK